MPFSSHKVDQRNFKTVKVHQGNFKTVGGTVEIYYIMSNDEDYDNGNYNDENYDNDKDEVVHNI